MTEISGKLPRRVEQAFKKKELLTLTVVAVAFGCFSPRTMRRFAEKGEIRFHNIARPGSRLPRRIVSRDDVLKFWNARAIKGKD